MSGKKEIDLYQVHEIVQHSTFLALRVLIIRLDADRGIDGRMRCIALTRLAEDQVQTQKDHDNQHEYFDSWCSSSSVKCLQLIFHDFASYVYYYNKGNMAAVPV